MAPEPGEWQPPPILSKLLPHHPGTRKYTVAQATKFVEFLAHWITTTNRLPATATVTRTRPNTLTMTVEIHDSPPAITPPQTPPTTPPQ